VIYSDVGFGFIAMSFSQYLLNLYIEFAFCIFLCYILNITPLHVEDVRLWAYRITW